MCTTNPQYHGRRQQGFTLVEVIIFIVVVGAGLAGILSVSSTVVKSSADPMVRKQAIAIAESLLEEISLKDYANPTGGYIGTVRSQFDDVNDYNGYTTSTGVVDVLGGAVAGLGNYNIAPPVEVVLQPVASSDLLGVETRRITVHVTDPQGNVISLTGYRTCDLSPTCPLP